MGETWWGDGSKNKSKRSVATNPEKVAQGINRSWNDKRDGAAVVNTHYLNVTECELQSPRKLQKIERGEKKVLKGGGGLE